MIDFKDAVTGESLDLFADTSISVEETNPLFETDNLKGTFIYPFDFPDTPGNRRKLGYPGELLNKNATGE